MSADGEERIGRDPAPAVSRAVRLLGLLADAQTTLTLTELATALALAKSSTANLCLALENADMIERVNGAYRLGRRVAELGGAFAAQFNQVREFYDVCAASKDLAGELVQLAILDGVDALYLARHEGSRTVRFGTPLGSRLPAALSATGRALLSRRSPEAVAVLFGDAPVFPDLTGQGALDLPGLMVKLDAARERGYAVDEDESFSGVFGVAVALEGWAPSDPDIALGVAIPVGEATPARVAVVAAALKDAAAALTNPFSEAARR